MEMTRRGFMMTTLAVGFALAVRPVSAETIVTDAEGLTAGEVKVPTAESMLIGSDQYDYAGYLVASKRFSKLDAHVNLGYTIVGHPAGVAVENTLNYAIAGEYSLAPRWTVVGEFLGNTAAVSGEGASNEATVTPEISGGEQIGMVGARYWLARRFVASLGVTVDNNGAILVRPGIGARF